MARDYHKEYESGKGKRTTFSISIDNETASLLKQKCEDNGITRNDILRACIEAYIDNSLTYEDGKLKMN